MIKDYIAFITVEYYDPDINANESNNFILTNISSYEEAVKITEAYYEPDLDITTINISLFEGPFLELGADLFTTLKDFYRN